MASGVSLCHMPEAQPQPTLVAGRKPETAPSTARSQLRGTRPAPVSASHLRAGPQRRSQAADPSPSFPLSVSALLGRNTGYEPNPLTGACGRSPQAQHHTALHVSPKNPRGVRDLGAGSTPGIVWADGSCLRAPNSRFSNWALPRAAKIRVPLFGCLYLIAESCALAQGMPIF